MRRRAFAVIVLFVAAACAQAAAGPPTVRLHAPPEIVAGRSWQAVVTVRPATRAGVRLVARLGRTQRVFAARGSGTTYRARVVLPTAGRWVLSARVGAKNVRLRAVTVLSPTLRLVQPAQLAFDSSGMLYLADQGRSVLYRIDPQTGRTRVVTRGLSSLYGVAVAPDGSVVIGGSGAVLRVDPRTGARTTLAGEVSAIGPIAVDGAGNVYYVAGNRLYHIDAAARARTVVAGNGEQGNAGDGGPATAAQLGRPHGLVFAADGALLISDSENHRVRHLDLASGVITAWADGLRFPGGIARDAAGNVYVAEFETQRITKLDSSGRVVDRVGVEAVLAVAVGPDGAIYTAVGSELWRIAPDGSRPAIALTR